MEQKKRTIVSFQNIQKSFQGEQVLYDINLDVNAGEFLTLLGPSGCGKTTLLRLLSGFERPTAGNILIDGKDVGHTPSHLRQVNTVFQSYALFPHMTIYDNVAFGLRCHKVAKSDIHDRVMSALSMVKLDHMAERKPSQLSGGQQQRVAIARAAVNKPLVLLLDEPLSALDYRLRQEMQLELKSLQRKLGITFILVTHDQEEALSISDRIAVMHDGRVQQLGTPRDIYETPVNLTVANFVGRANIFSTPVLSIEDNRLKVAFARREFTVKNKNKLAVAVNDNVNVLIRPEDFSVWDRTEVDTEEKQAMIPATVEQVVYKGSTVDLLLLADSGEKILATQFFDEDDSELNYRVGEKVWAEWRLDWEELLLE